MKHRTTSPNIELLADHEIFVFGSNLMGRHAGGAAKFAVLNFGAVEGYGTGIQGQSYAIPTIGHNWSRMDVQDIASHVVQFLIFAKHNPGRTFLVTEIGCGIAGYDPEDIAPLFMGAIDVENIHLPERFWTVLIKITAASGS